MNSNMNRDLIETIVKKALRDVRDSPERNVRNLVDMALLFSTGQFQRQFFEIAQKTLRNEYSAYYPMIRDAAFFCIRPTPADIWHESGVQQFDCGCRQNPRIRYGFSCPMVNRFRD